MSAERPAEQEDVDELNEQLQGGIETCRSVIANYRALLIDDQRADKASVEQEIAEDPQRASQ